MLFGKTKSFGLKISLTDKQTTRLESRVRAAGLTCWVDNTTTGSCYIAIGLPEWGIDINGKWYNTLDCGCNCDIAKIRLSGHDEGLQQDSTHNCVGSKGKCLVVLKRWVDEIITTHGPKGQKILSKTPENQLISIG